MKSVLKIKMQSMLLPGAGGGSAVVDTETVHDEYGIPYIPARRLKGLLRESALETSEMCSLSGLNWITGADVENVFGSSEERLIVRDCRIEGYEASQQGRSNRCRLPDRYQKIHLSQSPSETVPSDIRRFLDRTKDKSTP